MNSAEAPYSRITSLIYIWRY